MRTTNWLLPLIVAAAIAPGAMSRAAGPTSRPTHVRGTLVKVEGNDLVIRPRPRAGTGTGAGATTQPADAGADDVTFAADSRTHLSIDGEPGTLDGLKPGMAMDIGYIPPSPRLPGVLTLIATSKSIKGILVKRDETNLVLSVNQPGAEPKEVTVVTDENTRVRFDAVKIDGQRYPAHAGSLDDLKPGMKVRVIPETGTATKIFITPTASDVKPGG